MRISVILAGLLGLVLLASCTAQQPQQPHAGAVDQAELRDNLRVLQDLLRAIQQVQRLTMIAQAVDVQQIADCLRSRLGDVLSPDQIQTVAYQLLQAVESEGYSGSAALAEALETCKAITAVQEVWTG